MSALNSKSYFLKNNTGNAIQLLGASVTGSNDYHVEFSWSETGLPLDFNAHPSGQVVYHNTPITMTVSYLGSKSREHNYDLNEPRVNIEYECPAESGNKVSIDRRLSGSVLPPMIETSNSIYISIANHRYPDAPGMALALKPKTSRSGEKYWETDKFDQILYGGKTISPAQEGRHDLPGRYKLYFDQDVGNYRADDGVWTISLITYPASGQREVAIMRYNVKNEYYLTAESQLPNLTDSSFPMNMSYYIPGAANGESMAWRPIASADTWNHDLFLLFKTSPPVTYDSQIVAGGKYDHISDVRCMHDVISNPGGESLDIAWETPSSNLADVCYMIEYTPYSTQNGEVKVVYKYLIDRASWGRNGGTNSLADVLTHHYNLTLPYNMQSTDVNGDRDYDGLVDVGANSIRIVPILPILPGLTTLASSDTIYDTFPTLNFKVDPDKRELTVDVQVNGLRGIERSGTGVKDIWGTGLAVGNPAGEFAYAARMPSAKIQLKVTAKEKDISILNGFASIDRDWARTVDIRPTQNGIKTLLNGDGFNNGSIILPVLNDDSDTYNICWTLGNVTRCIDMSIDQVEFTEPEFPVPEGCAIGATHKLSTTSNSFKDGSAHLIPPGVDFVMKIDYEYFSPSTGEWSSAVNTVTVNGSNMGEITEHNYATSNYDLSALALRNVKVTDAAGVTRTLEFEPYPDGQTRRLDYQAGRHMSNWVYGKIRVPYYERVVDAAGNDINIFAELPLESEYIFSRFLHSSSDDSVLWTVPENVHEVELFLVGGGASGISGYTNGRPAGAGGGAGGQVNWLPVAVTPGEEFKIIVAKGGDSNNGGGQNDISRSNAGGTTSISRTDSSGWTVLVTGGGSHSDARVGGSGGTTVETEFTKLHAEYYTDGNIGQAGYYDNGKSQPGHGGSSNIPEEIIKQFNLLPERRVDCSGTARGWAGIGGYPGDRAANEHNWENQGSSRRGIYGSGGGGKFGSPGDNEGGDGMLIIRKSSNVKSYHEDIDRVLVSAKVDEHFQLEMTVDGHKYDIPRSHYWRVRERFDGLTKTTVMKNSTVLDVSWTDWDVIVESRGSEADQWIQIHDSAFKPYREGGFSGPINSDRSSIPLGGDCITIKTKHTI